MIRELCRVVRGDQADILPPNSRLSVVEMCVTTWGGTRGGELDQTGKVTQRAFRRIDTAARGSDAMRPHQVPPCPGHRRRRPEERGECQRAGPFDGCGWQ